MVENIKISTTASERSVPKLPPCNNFQRMRVYSRKGCQILRTNTVSHLFLLHLFFYQLVVAARPSLHQRPEVSVIHWMLINYCTMPDLSHELVTESLVAKLYHKSQPVTSVGFQLESFQSGVKKLSHCATLLGHTS